MQASVRGIQPRRMCDTVVTTQGTRVRVAQGKPANRPSNGFPMRKQDELLERVARRMEPRMRREFLAAVSSVKLPVGAITDAFEAGNINRVMQLIRDAIGKVPSTAMSESLRATFTAMARPTASGIGISFTLVNPEAVAFAATQSSTLIGGIGENLPAMRRVVASAFTEGKAPRVLAREVERLIGLTPAQTLRVDRFIAGRVEAGLTQARIDTLTRRFSAKLLRQRAVTIARHETIAAGVQGKLATWNTAIAEGIIDPTVTVKVWQTARDDRVCAICIPLDGRIIKVEGGVFNTIPEDKSAQAARTAAGLPARLPRKVAASSRKMDFARVEGPPAHVACRCSVGQKSFTTVSETRAALKRGSI